MLKRALSELEVVVHPERYRAGLLAIELGADIVLLDDGLQHLQLARDLEICVLDATRGQSMGMENGRCLPAGPLREPVQRLAEVASSASDEGKTSSIFNHRSHIFDVQNFFPIHCFYFF